METKKFVVRATGGLFAAFVAVGFALPDESHLERSVDIAAPICNVHEVLRQIARFNEYSAWAKKDPGAKFVFGGAQTGAGSKMSWTSDVRAVGAGKMILVKEERCTSLDVALEFGPDEAQAHWALSEAGGQTHVVYSFDGHAQGRLVARYFNLVMDSVVGADYEATLAGLKRVVEAGPSVDIAGVDVDIVDLSAQPYAYSSVIAPKATGLVSASLAPGFARVMAALSASGVASTGPALLFTDGETAAGYRFKAAVPIASPPSAPFADAGVVVGHLKAGRTAKYAYKGAYSGLAAAHERVRAWMRIHRYDVSHGSWEEFVNDPATTAESDLLTNIYYSIN